MRGGSGSRGGEKRKGFRDAAAVALSDPRLQAALDKALGVSQTKRAERVAERPDWEALRDRARDIRQRALDDRPELIRRFRERLEAHGCQVHEEADASSACARVLDIVRQRGAQRLVKSKSMTTEEIGLNDALEAEGYGIVETDLGEYIIQLRGEGPSHVTAPALHLSAATIGETFHEHLGIPLTDDATALTKAARRALREDFLGAEVGISSANFALANSGTLVIVENEGNARLATSVPRVHIAVVGVDKLVHDAADLPTLLALLPASATGQRATAYVSLIDGPRASGEGDATEADGPEELHVVLVDNGRSALRGDPELRSILRCIRCGACQNACPVFRHTGGHAYVGAYGGPFGSILEPAMRSHGWDEPFASSLCGACADVCPVRIDLPALLLELRRRAVSGRALPAARPPRRERWGFRLWRSAMSGPRRLRFASWLFRLGWRVFPGLVRRVQARMGWGASRALPPPARRPFRASVTLPPPPERVGAASTAVAPAATPARAPDDSGGPDTSRADLLASFVDQLKRCDGRASLCQSPRDALSKLATIAAEAEGAPVWVEPAVEALLPGATEAAGAEPLAPDTSLAERASARIVVTTASALVADIGTVYIRAAATPTRTASVLAERHVIVVPRTALVPDLAAALAGDPPGQGARWRCLVTGPSRTADVEKILVLGAHGPLALDVLIV